MGLDKRVMRETATGLRGALSGLPVPWFHEQESAMELQVRVSHHMSGLFVHVRRERGAPEHYGPMTASEALDVIEAVAAVYLEPLRGAPTE